MHCNNSVFGQVCLLNTDRRDSIYRSAQQLSGDMRNASSECQEWACFWMKALQTCRSLSSTENQRWMTCCSWHRHIITNKIWRWAGDLCRKAFSLQWCQLSSWDIQYQYMPLYDIWPFKFLQRNLLEEDSDEEEDFFLWVCAKISSTELLGLCK